MSAAPWLSIVGLGEDGLAGLSPLGRSLIDAAEILVGGERHLAMIPTDGRERHTWTRPLTVLLEQIRGWRGRSVCVLATGDPLAFGVGTSLAHRFPASEMTIVPTVSAFSLACARMGWPLTEVEQVTIHGRPVELVNAVLYPGARIIALSADGGSPAAIAKLLAEQGYAESRITVLEHMGGPKERRIDATAATFAKSRFADLNTVAIECIAAPTVRALPRVGGLPDSAFINDGQLTKREVRAATLAALAPFPGQLLWDIGAGSGSVAIEWLRATRNARAIAVESHPERVRAIAANANALGVPRLKIIAGAAPDALAGIEAPDAVFIGGGLTRSGELIERCWQALHPRGRLVANVVTLDGEAAVTDAMRRLGGDLVRLSVARAEPMGRVIGWRPLVPVTQYAVVKAP